MYVSFGEIRCAVRLLGMSESAHCAALTSNKQQKPLTIKSCVLSSI